MKRLGFGVTIFLIIGSIVSLLISIPEIEYVSRPDILESTKEEKKDEPPVEIEDGIYAEIYTTRGEILAELYYKQAPGTVGNFVGLAEGSLENAVYPKGRPFYDGMPFYNVLPYHYIETGDPLGTGLGGPGYEFADEFHPELKHDKPGKLAMISRGTNGNGSQFYITSREAEIRDGVYPVFGEVILGQDVVNMIKQGDEINKINILRKGTDAQRFEAVKAFENLNRKLSKKMTLKVSSYKQQRKNNGKWAGWPNTWTSLDGKGDYIELSWIRYNTYHVRLFFNDELFDELDVSFDSAKSINYQKSWGKEQVYAYSSSGNRNITAENFSLGEIYNNEKTWNSIDPTLIYFWWDNMSIVVQ